MEGQEFLEWLGRHRSPVCVLRGHTLVAVYDRPWRQFFRKHRILRCWQCGEEIAEPIHLRRYPLLAWWRRPSPISTGTIMARGK